MPIAARTNATTPSAIRSVETIRWARKAACTKSVIVSSAQTSTPGRAR
jgi:hypothetical protein